MKSKSISVIIPMYNSEKTIERCLRSVMNQSKLNLIGEVIIINDGSSDQGEQKVYAFMNNYYSGNIKFHLLSQQNRGVSSARNNGIKHSSCDWIAFLDSDDEWNNFKIENQAAIIDQFNDTEMVGGNITDKKQRIGFFQTPIVSKVYYKNMLIRSFPYTSTVLVRKNSLFSNGLFDESQSHCEDMNLFVKIAQNGGYYHLNKQLVVYDGGKKPIGGIIGLSSNLVLMNEGAKKNIKEFYKLGLINKCEYIILLWFNRFKYIRCICIKKLNLLR